MVGWRWITQKNFGQRSSVLFFDCPTDFSFGSVQAEAGNPRNPTVVLFLKIPRVLCSYPLTGGPGFILDCQPRAGNFEHDRFTSPRRKFRVHCSRFGVLLARIYMRGLLHENRATAGRKEPVQSEPMISEAVAAEFWMRGGDFSGGWLCRRPAAALAHAQRARMIRKTEIVVGDTGYQPVPLGHWPDGTAAARSM